MGEWCFKPARFLYSMGLTLAWPALYSFYAAKSLQSGKYRRNHPFRMGLEEPSFPREGHRVWIHALSVGETLSVVPFVKALRHLLPRTSICFSSSTETGHDMAVRHLGPWVDAFFFMPHDFPWLVKRYVSLIQPRVFVLVETDLWPNLALELKKQGACTVLLNGRLSHDSFRRLVRWKRFWKPIYASFQWIFTQSEMDRARYEALGGPKGRVQARGNIKLDASFEKVSTGEISELRTAAGIGPHRRVWIAGSTHAGEEELLLAVHAGLRKAFPDLLLVLAPRQVHRSPELVRKAEEQGFQVALRSKGERAQGKDVFLLDTLGELRKFYALGQAAFIGGSFVPFGGHNPLEATAQLIPAFWGPHLFNFREMEEELVQAGCGFVVSSKEELKGRLEAFFRGRERQVEVLEKAASFWSTRGGASGRIARLVFEECFLKEPPPQTPGSAACEGEE